MENRIIEDEGLLAIVENFRLPFYLIKEEKISFCNKESLKLFGYKSKEDIIGKKPYELSPIKQSDNLSSYDKGREVIRIAKEKGFYSFYWLHKKENGEIFDSKVLLYSKNDILIAIIISKDKIENDNIDKLIIDEMVNILSKIDLETGMYNKNYLKELIKETINVAKRNKESFALFFIDYDNFKEINENLGHEIGDILLKRTSKEIKNMLCKNCTIGRYGGDDFIVLSYPVNDKKEILNIGRKILEVFNKPFEIEGNIINLKVSIGVSIYPNHGTNRSELLKKADIAVYYSKKEKELSNKIKVFEMEMENEFKENYQI